MAVVVIDTIKPKNQGTFPVVEAKDVKVDNNDKRLDTALGEKASQADVTALQTAVAGKASQADLTALSNAVSGKASQSDLTALSNTVADKADKSALAETNAAVAGKQAALTEEQLTAVNSGITSDLVTQISTNTSAIAGKADASDLTALETEVDTKADTADVNTATANLQSQINNIVGGSTEDSEVINARVGVDGKSYSTLKSRLDNEQTSDVLNINYIKDTLYNTDNLLIDAKIYKNKYYTGGTSGSNSSYSYAIVPMLAAKTYILSRARFVAYATGSAVEEYVTDNTEFTPSADGDVYITFYNDAQYEWYVYEKGKDASLIGTYQHPALGNVLTQTTGTSATKAISQKAATDALNALGQQLENEYAQKIEVSKINEASIKDGTDLSPLVTETGSGRYRAYNGQIQYIEESGFNYIKLPIQGGETYYFNDRITDIFTTDANGDIVEYSNDVVFKFATTSTATLLWASYPITSPYASTRKVAINKILDSIGDTTYIFDKNVEGYNDSENQKTLNILDKCRNKTNIFNDCDLVENQYYANQWGSNNSYSVFVIHAKAGKTYKFGCAMRFFYSIDSSTEIASNTSAGYTYTPAADTILYCTVNNTDSGAWKAVITPDELNDAPNYGDFAFNSDLIVQATGTSKTKIMSQKAVTEAIAGVSAEADVKNKIYGKGFATTTGNLADGESLTLVGTNVKKNNVYSFMAKVTTFSKVLIGHALTGYSGSWAEITNSKLIIHNYFSEDSTVEYTHGLTISDYIYVQIIVKNSNKADVIIYSNGTTFTQTNVNWYGDGYGSTFAKSTGSTLTDCTFTWSSGDFRKSIWMFGDSYFGISDSSRWCKYLTDAGYADNVLLNAYAGEGTNSSLTALNNMLSNYGKPDKIVWCLGMNDGSDTDSTTPSATWANGISQLESICTANNITLILATIPTVPSINHEGKNNYVRNSDYRYIDFAKAVGADGTGTWYTDMLSSDNVHPTALGAKALYHRAIADCPEITYSNP